MLAADGKDALRFRRNIGKQHARAESTLSMIAFSPCSSTSARAMACTLKSRALYLTSKCKVTEAEISMTLCFLGGLRWLGFFGGFVEKEDPPCAPCRQCPLRLQRPVSEIRWPIVVLNSALSEASAPAPSQRAASMRRTCFGTILAHETTRTDEPNLKPTYAINRDIGSFLYLFAAAPGQQTILNKLCAMGHGVLPTISSQATKTPTHFRMGLSCRRMPIWSLEGHPSRERLRGPVFEPCGASAPR